VTPTRRASVRRSALLLAAGAWASAPALEAQLRIAPEIAYSRVSDFGTGIRVAYGLTVNGWAFVEALEFFPGSDGVADPGVGVNSDYRQIHGGLYYTGRRAALQPYAGASAGWFTSSLTLEQDGASATADRTELFGQILAGMRLPRSRITPWVEARRMFDEPRPWIFSMGLDVFLR
jgi:hypothetical protein